MGLPPHIYRVNALKMFFNNFFKNFSLNLLFSEIVPKSVRHLASREICVYDDYNNGIRGVQGRVIYPTGGKDRKPLVVPSVTFMSTGRTFFRC